ncbi:hypothetical protein [Hydrogenophaga sp.]|uniref:hypothetical protein n=1 Tax=Hydrogenophaga sp. TaxID=1904254 RepID=UPI00271F8980|nr:hypothetical protein [Hydrogenophaga sp.]MDO9434070.1 hypothetical protein [Hydrogenophaga sp.]
MVTLLLGLRVGLLAALLPRLSLRPGELVTLSRRGVPGSDSVSEPMLPSASKKPIPMVVVVAVVAVVVVVVVAN